MVTIRRSEERGHFNHGWLDTYHSFSFGGYYDPRYSGFRVLRVINEDRIQPGLGFPTHSHANMEIITLVSQGSLEHKDSMGHKTVIHAGEVQRMSAGTGITHSEYNHSRTEIVHLHQIWIFPEEADLEPGYEQTAFSDDEKRGRLRLIASPDGRDGSLTVHQAIYLYATILGPGQKVIHPLHADRYAWLQVTRGALELNGQPMKAGDGASVADEGELTIAGVDDGQVLLFDLP